MSVDPASEKASLLHVADISLVAKLRHVHLLGTPLGFRGAVLHLLGQFSQFFYLELVDLELLLLLPDYHELTFLFLPLDHQLQVNCFYLVLPSLFPLAPLCLKPFDLYLKALNHVVSDGCFMWFLVLGFFTIEG